MNRQKVPKERNPSEFWSGRPAGANNIVVLPALIAALVLQSTSYRGQYPLPHADLNGIGVDIHFVQPPDGEVVQIAKAGFKWIRMDFLWTLVEKHQGHYYFKDYDLLMDALGRNHLRPIFIFDTIQDSYGSEPADPAVRQAFCNFVRASVERFKHRGIVWEIWNEPNLDDYWKPHASAEEYASFAMEVAKTIRSVSSDEWIVGPALSHTDWPYLEAVFKDGLLNWVDGVTIHPYRSEAPETVIADWAHLKSLIEEYKPAGKRIPMMCGEWGYSDLQTGLDTQADYAGRMVLVDLMCGVDTTVWYDWKDDVDAPEGRERHFGIVHEQPGDKPASAYLTQLEKVLAGYHFERRLPAPDGAYEILFSNGIDNCTVAWAQNGEGIDVPVGNFREMVNAAGDSANIAGQQTFHIGSTPTIFK